MGSREVQEGTEAAGGLVEELRLKWLEGQVVSLRRAGARQVARATTSILVSPPSFILVLACFFNNSLHNLVILCNYQHVDLFVSVSLNRM